ncbi:neprilysin-1-like isoform X1 [Centruroides vittatus]|uniref:neprilysin-1-like isoform X1 n=2 Tax=Centruroides vittatus TaxID=120091 RepID=UPI003510073A
MNWFMWLLLIVLLHEANQAKDENNTSKKKICETEACKLSATVILNCMNKSVDPCEDFYSFSCDGWMKKKHLDGNVIKSIRMEILLDIIKVLEEAPEKSLTKIERKIIKIYNTCKAYETFDNDTVKWFEDLFEKIGGFPMLNPEWNEDDYDWIEAFSQLSLIVHLEPLILVQSTIDNRNPSRNILMISQPPRGEAVNIKAVALYPLYFAKARGEQISTERGGTAYNDILDLNILQDKLNSIYKYEEDFDDTDKLESIMKIRDLQNLIPSIDLIGFLRRATGHLITINEDDDIAVKSAHYIISLIEMINNGTISKRTIANFLSYNAFVKIIQYFPKSSNYLIENFRPKYMKRSVIDINQTDTDREFTSEETHKIVCLYSIMLPLNFAVDHMFITRKKPWQSKLNDVVENLSISLRQILKKQNWIDKDTKKFLLDKQKEMAAIYDYPKWINDPSNIEKFYESFPEVTNDPLENYLLMVQFARRENLLFITNENNRLKWPLLVGISASTLNAYYLKGFNTVMLPFVLKHPKIFNQQRPNYLNYGSVGMIIGHEMGHGFDKYSIQRDKHGVLVNWTNDNFKKGYLKRSQCLVDQYSNYTLNKFGIQLDGKKTLSQNIADHIGLRISYRAFKREERLRGREPFLAGLEEYTSDQLFFISFATSWCQTEEATENYWKNDKSDHSPSKFRILGTVTNTKEFSKAFKCKKGSKMNRSKKCNIL